MEAPTAYVRPVVRIAVRCRQQNGQWAVGVLISTLSARDVLHLTGRPLSEETDPLAVLLAYVTDLAISAEAPSKPRSRATSKDWA
jgi:hypothetical protein